MQADSDIHCQAAGGTGDHGIRFDLGYLEVGVGQLRQSHHQIGQRVEIDL
jgi:hypothetical protein